MQPELVSFIENRFQDAIRARVTLEAQPGASVPFPKSLDEKLASELEKQGIRSLYSHQAETFGAVSRGQDVVIVSRTASGKTLSFLLPILNDYLASRSPFSVLLLYPTKALSRDQEGTLGDLMKAATGSRHVGTFDGDTPREERVKLQKSGDFIITNPDMLHSGILPNHNRRWKTFLSRLKYVVVDEVHTYRGAFGSHVANVMRRLLRVCETHGSRPVFVCSSATIGNPGPHVEALFHRAFRVVDQDGSPRPSRLIYFVNPPLVLSHGNALYRKGPGSVSVPLIREAARLGVRTIAFCRARQEVERVYRAVTDGHPNLQAIVQPYRGGLLPNERRRLERDLFDGRIKAVITTNALELGIDIGDLDLCILSGHPGTLASFWQQAGRVGRKGNRALIVYVARDAPVDQYLVHHPDFVTSSPVEEAWLSADNPYILLQHLPCAAHEHPLRPEEPLFQASTYEQARETLKEDGTVVPYRDSFRYALSDYPARGVNLRGLTDYNVEIFCGSEVIGEIDPIGARGTLYKDAIYQHLGRRYMSMDLNLEQKLCRVEPVNVDYYTEAVWENRIVMNEVEETRTLHGSELRFGYITVNKQPKLYKKIRERTFENIGYGPITLPAFEYETTGFSLVPSVFLREGLDGLDKRYLGAGLFGLSYILRRAAPSLCMGDTSDIHTDVSLADETDASWKSALFVYDAIEGGVGFSEKICERIEEALDLCLRIIRECECRSGCPACVPPLPPGIESDTLSQLLVESNAAVECTVSLIRNLLSGDLVLPDVRFERSALPEPVAPPPVDEEALKLQKRLRKASGILRKKRGRLH